MIKIKPSVTLITKAFFWRQGAGFWARTRETVIFLAEHTDLQVIILGVISEQDIAQLRDFKHIFKLNWLGVSKTNRQQFWKKAFLDTHDNKPTADFYIIDKIQNSFMLNVLPRSAKIILDTHDLVSHRASKAAEYGIPDNFPLSEQQEQELLSQYDAVICIQNNDLRTVSQWIGENKALYMPMPQHIHALPINDIATNIGMVASGWHANTNGLRKFLKDVWPQLGTEIHLHIFGNICNRMQGIAIENVTFHGFQTDLESCYQGLDIAINPVYYGAGLKIKSIEALAHGLPLITTQEGASGIEYLNGSSLLIAEDSIDFAKKITQLINDRPTRAMLANNGLNHIETHFNKTVCFRDLSNYLGLQ